MSPVRSAPTPRGLLYRVGRLPDPLAWPPREFVGGGRFDDPEREFRVLYTGTRRACFLETLAPFRPSVAMLAQLRQVTATEEPMPLGFVPPSWYQRRAIAQLRLTPGQRWLDLRATATREALRVELAPALVDMGVEDMDVSEVTGRERRLTQAIARWAFKHGYAGIAYRSRFDETLSLWAVFERAEFKPARVPEPIFPDDPDLVAAAELFGLRLD